MFLVDCHCHLDLFENFEKAVIDADQNKIFTIAVTTTPRAWSRNQSLASKTSHVRASLGFHPQLVSVIKDEFSIFSEFVDYASFIGEIGLDASQKFYGSLDDQVKILSEILECIPRGSNKILSIHSLRASKKILDILESYFPPEKGKVILHWFTGGPTDAKRAIELGYYFSINSQMGRTTATQKLISNIPDYLLLTESDLPFTEKKQSPSQINKINDALTLISDIRFTNYEKIKALVWNNFCCLLDS